MTEWRVPLFDLDLSGEEYRSVKEVLDSRWLTMGQVTKDFESAFADYLGVKHALAVSSGTAAMHLAHHAMGLGEDDEVICPSFTFVATANAVRYTGATPVFADITSFDDLTISRDDIEAKINERTKGIVVVHYAGVPCNMDRIMGLAEKHNLYVVEDAAHAIGAEYGSISMGHSAERIAREKEQHPDGTLPSDNTRRQAPSAKRYAQKMGTIGDIGCFSFFSNKNMTTAEGGMVVTNNDDLAEKIRIARSHGMTSLTWDRHEGHSFSYDVVGLGFNYRIDELRSSLGLVQLGKLDDNNKQRESLWGMYKEQLSGVDEIQVPFSEFDGVPSYHILPVLLSDKIDRQGFIGHLRQKGIQTSIHYPPIHLFSYYKIVSPDIRLPVTEEVGRREVTLPLFPTMTEEQLTYVVNSIIDYLSQSRS